MLWVEMSQGGAHVVCRWVFLLCGFFFPIAINLALNSVGSNLIPRDGAAGV